MIEVVAERLEGAPRRCRRHWSDEFKERAVAEADQFEGLKSTSMNVIINTVTFRGDD